MSSYEKIKKIKNRYRYDYFAMACSHFFDIGYRNALAITEEEIENAEGNDLMTKEFVQWLMKTAKEIAEASETAVDLVQFCIAEDIYDIQYYANKIPRWKLKEMIQQRIMYDEYDFSKKEDVEEACEKYDCDAEDFESLGYTVTEDYFD